MYEKNVNKLLLEIKNRNSKNELPEVLQHPTEDNPVLNYRSSSMYGSYNFGQALPVLEVDNGGRDDVSVSSEKVKNLRDKYGYGIMDCKKALQKANGNVEEAYNILRRTI